jgi:hypothetical protein
VTLHDQHKDFSIDITILTANVKHVIEPFFIRTKQEFYVKQFTEYRTPIPEITYSHQIIVLKSAANRLCMIVAC